MRLFVKSLIDFNESLIPYSELQFLDRPSIVAHSPAALMYMAVHRNIQVTTLTIVCIQFCQGLECMWKKS